MTMKSDDGLTSSTEPKTVPAWPHLVVREMAVAFFVTAGILGFSIAFPLDLLPPADPSAAEFAAKAPWFFVGMQEMLYHLPPAYAASVIPAIVILFLYALPYLSWRHITFTELNAKPQKWVLPIIFLCLSASFYFLAVIPFVTQAVLTLLFACLALILISKPAWRISRISVWEFSFCYMICSYAMWTIVGLFLRTSDWSWVFDIAA